MSENNNKKSISVLKISNDKKFLVAYIDIDDIETFSIYDTIKY